MIHAGVDEVGRGPLAGPLIAAAVVLPDRFDLEGLTDSKKLSPKKRRGLGEEIKRQALCWAIGRADVDEIDRINIFEATLVAMRRAVKALTIAPDLCLIDGKWAPVLDCATQTIVKGDLYEPSISAASIIAKVERDAEMCQLHKQYPLYGFDTNKGYATPQHLGALHLLGACDVHRKSFAPVSETLDIQVKLDF